MPELSQANFIEGYRLLKSCGRGAAGEVFLAEDTTVGQRVALKIFYAEQPDEKAIRALQCYMLLPQHPNICRILHCGKTGGRLYYTMEAADNANGETVAEDGDEVGRYLPDTLARRMGGKEPMPLDEVFGICTKLLDALEVLHNSGMAHRDVKPENIVFVGGELKLADFGLLADLNHTLSLAGTIGFLPPEVIAGKKKMRGGECDLYAVGKIFYTLATGSSPADYPLLPEGLPNETLARICVPMARLCSQNPRKRCKNAADARALLNGSAESKDSALRRLLGKFRIMPKFRKRCMVMALAVILTVALAVVGTTAAVVIHARRHSARVAAAQSELDRFLTVLEKLPLQLPDYPCGEIRAKLTETANGGSDVLLRQQIADERMRLRKTSQDACVRLAPQAQNPAETTSSPMARFRFLAEGWGFAQSPLATFLPSDEAAAFQKELRSATEELMPAQNMPRLGESYSRAGWVGGGKWLFVPPGNYWSPSQSRVETVEMPFWIFDEPLNNETYLWLAGDARNERLPKESHAGNLSWNDILLFCKKATERLRAVLPPGYAVRPPTEAEWEDAVGGGWTTTADGYGLRKGLSAEYKEVVLPTWQTLPEELRNSYLLLRGGAPAGTSRQEALAAAAKWEHVCKDTPAIGYSALRLVIGPTPADFFEMQWYHGAVWRQTIRPDGHIYLGRIVSNALTKSAHARRLASLLGARLPEPDSVEELSAIYADLRLLPHLPGFLGADYSDHAWHWLSDGHVAALPKLPVFLDGNGGNDTARVLNLGGDARGRWTPLAPDDHMPVMILEWMDQNAFDDRLRFREKLNDAPDAYAPFLRKVTIGGRDCVLLQFSCAPDGAEAIAELLGTHLAIAQNPEELRALAEGLRSLAPHDRVLIGCFRYYDKWRWRDGTPADFPTLPDDPIRFQTTSHLLDGLVLHNGIPTASTIPTALLLESW